jgi:hypothetical protein
VRRVCSVGDYVEDATEVVHALLQAHPSLSLAELFASQPPSFIPLLLSCVKDCLFIGDEFSEELVEHVVDQLQAAAEQRSATGASIDLLGILVIVLFSVLSRFVGIDSGCS